MNNRVKSLLVLNGIKQVTIARELSVRPSSVSLIVSGKKTSKRIRKAIARMLKMKIEDLWPANKRKAA